VDGLGAAPSAALRAMTSGYQALRRLLPEEKDAFFLALRYAAVREGARRLSTGRSGALDPLRAVDAVGEPKLARQRVWSSPERSSTRVSLTNLIRASSLSLFPFSPLGVARRSGAPGSSRDGPVSSHFHVLHRRLQAQAGDFGQSPLSLCSRR